MPGAIRLTVFLLQKGLLCLALCCASIAPNFFFGLRPYRAPNRFVDDDILYSSYEYNMGPPGFEPGLERPKRSVIDQATLRPQCAFINVMLKSS